MRRTALSFTLAAAASFHGMSSEASAQGFIGALEQQKLVAADGSFQDQFGFVAIDGDTLVGGALGDVTGSAYVFVRTGTAWSQQAKLLPGVGAPADEFGLSVAIDGDTVVVGARGHDFGGSSDLDFGAAFVYVRSGTAWSEQAVLSAPDADLEDSFGWSVDVSGDTLVVGAPEDDDAGFGSGSAHVYVRIGTVWNHQAKLVDQGGTGMDHFGISVALDVDTAAIGCSNDDDAGFNAGSVYAYVRSGTTWSLQGKLLATDAGSNDNLGQAVALDGDTIIVGTKNDDSPGAHSGAAYVFARSGTSWSQEAKLLAIDAIAGTRYATAVSVSGDTAVVGDFFDDDFGFSGSAYVYLRSGTSWSHLAKVFANDRASFDLFGLSVAVDDATIAVGASGNDDACPGNPSCESGSAYAFALIGGPETYCTGKTNSFGCVPFITFSGTASASDSNPFRIVGNEMGLNESGLLIYGYKEANLNFHGGKLCVKSPLKRTPVKKAKTVPSTGCPVDLLGRLTRNFNKTIQNGNDPMLTPGQQVNAQWIQRDANDPAGFGDSFTNGLQFVIGP